MRIFILGLFFILCGCVPKVLNESYADSKEYEIVEESICHDSIDVLLLTYEQLDEERQLLISSWEAGAVTEVVLDEEMGMIDDLSFVGQAVYLVQFPLKTLWIPNELMVFVSMDTCELIGYGYIE